jgi:membrane protein involved in colicin uptake
VKTKGAMNTSDVKKVLNDPEFMVQLIKTMPQQTQELFDQELQKVSSERLEELKWNQKRCKDRAKERQENELKWKQERREDRAKSFVLLKIVITIIWIIYCIIILGLFATCSFFEYVMFEPATNLFFIAIPFIASSMCAVILIVDCE